MCKDNDVFILPEIILRENARVCFEVESLGEVTEKVQSRTCEWIDGGRKTG